MAKAVGRMSSNSATQQEPLCHAKDVAALLGSSVSHVYRAAARGEIPCYRIGSLVRFRMSEIEACLAESRRHAAEAPPLAVYKSARRGAPGRGG